MTRKVNFRSAALLIAVAVVFSAIPVAQLSASEGEEISKDSKAWLGVYMQDVTDDIKEAFDLETDRGVFVDDVVDNSPADEAGIEAKDVIIRIDSDPIADSKDLILAVAKRNPGDSVQIVVIRDGKESAIAAELGRERSSKMQQWYGDKSNAWHNLPGIEPFSLMWSAEGGYLGVSTVELSDQLAEYFDVEDGVLVSEVEKDTPAEKAGVKAGDVITKIDGEIVESQSDLREIIRDHDKGDKVAVDLIRKGLPMTLTAELDETSGGSSYGNAIQQYLGQSRRAPGADRLRMFYSDEDQKALQEEMEQLKEELKSLKDELGEIRERMK